MQGVLLARTGGSVRSKISAHALEQRIDKRRRNLRRRNHQPDHQ